MSSSPAPSDRDAHAAAQDRRSTLIVVYCPHCDYFLKTAVQVVAGTHGCAKCDGLMEVYVPQELMRPRIISVGEHGC